MKKVIISRYDPISGKNKRDISPKRGEKSTKDSSSKNRSSNISIEREEEKKYLNFSYKQKEIFNGKTNTLRDNFTAEEKEVIMLFKKNMRHLESKIKRKERAELEKSNIIRSQLLAACKFHPDGTMSISPDLGDSAQERYNDLIRQRDAQIEQLNKEIQDISLFFYNYIQNSTKEELEVTYSALAKCIKALKKIFNFLTDDVSATDIFFGTLKTRYVRSLTMRRKQEILDKRKRSHNKMVYFAECCLSIKIAQDSQ